jgi:hypothetical protein
LYGAVIVNYYLVNAIFPGLLCAIVCGGLEAHVGVAALRVAPQIEKGLFGGAKKPKVTVGKCDCRRQTLRMQSREKVNMFKRAILETCT